MDIKDLETANEVGCTPCGYPLCPPPVIECQSITVIACGEQMPIDPSAVQGDSRFVPAEDRCKIYKTVTDQTVTTVTFNGPSEEGVSKSGSVVDDYKCVYSWKWKTVPPEEEGGRPEWECDGDDVTTSLSSIEDSAYYVNGEKQYDLNVSTTSSSSPGVPCSGSQTITQTEEGEDPSTETNPYNVCDCPGQLDVAQAAVVYAGGVFTLTTIDSSDPLQTYNITWTLAYTDQVVLADLVAEAEARAAVYGDTHDWPGTECQSKVNYSYGYPIPEEEPEELEEEEEPEPEPEPVCKQVSEVIYSSYFVGVPEDYSTVELPRSVFKATWDEYFFPTVWDLWDSAVELYEQWEKEHAEWVDGGSVGPEPVEPPAPGAEPTDRPVLVNAREWIWSGSMEEPRSPRYVLSIPPESQVPGMTRRVNLATWCYNSTRTGVLPTFHGEIYVPPDEEEGEP